MRDLKLLHPITHSASPFTPDHRPRPRELSNTPPASAMPGVHQVPTGVDRRIVVPEPPRPRTVVPGGYSLDELPDPLRRLCSALEEATVDGEIPLDTMYAELDRLEHDLQMLAPWWIFDAVTYRRNLIRRTPSYEALLLCWLPGQKSPIHDHRGSGCAFRVMEGVVTETLYERERDGRVCATSMRWLPPGAICASREFDIHEVANTQAETNLVTLHVYSPPLANVNLYAAVESAPAS